MGTLLSILLAGVVLLMVIVLVLTWMVFDLSRDVKSLAKLCGKCTEDRIRQAKGGE